MPVSTADQLAIQALVTRYNRAIDHGDVATWVDCFTEDGVFDGIPGRFEGSAQLRGFAEDLSTGELGAPFRPMRHWTTNFLIDYDGGPDAARMRADHLLFRQTGASPDEAGELLVMAVYRDRLRRVAGGWRFSERHIEPQGKQGV